MKLFSFFHIIRSMGSQVMQIIAILSNRAHFLCINLSFFSLFLTWCLFIFCCNENLAIYSDVYFVVLQLKPDKENVVGSRDDIYVRRAASALDFSRPAPKSTATVGSKHPSQHVLKRKVLRKVDGQVSISESFTESEASGQ